MKKSSWTANSHFELYVLCSFCGLKIIYHKRHKENKGNYVPFEGSAYDFSVMKRVLQK
tara:strand:+ start:2945 stop:3118 length:174 start_codon:yes stop_codon:yes gene_type:complete